MAIEAVTIPKTRSRVWTPQDAKQAYDVLTGANGAEPSSVKYGEYESESLARTRGMALDRLIESLFGRRFACSVWKNQEGQFVGALDTKPPTERKSKPKGRGK